MGKSKQLYLSHFLCSSEPNPGSRPFRKVHEGQMTFFMATRSNVIFQQMKLRISAILHFHVFLTGQYISEIILNIQGHRQGHFQGQIGENIIFNK